ncbi:granzyme A-like isoform X1 [Anabas testudineus]|uniref:Peptidase S1 domain-containing protein n=1 Tax=Anabas testudineus TaxID=64144 RepID=A0A3Q1KD30_ANATE|nr:granzyme A-like isoform X1 [Anabas testudineus]
MFCQMGFTALISCTVLLIVQTSDGSEIIGGKEVKPHSMPFMALLKNNTTVCGGTLISPSWVLTAAHCKDIKTVLLGVHSIKEKKNEKNSRQIRKVKKQFPHPSYDEKKKVNDLMLLKLDKPAKPTKTVGLLKLDKTIQDPKAGTICVVAGWGTTNNTTKQMSDVLMSVKVTVVDRKKCNSPKCYNRAITNDMVCAGSNGKKRADTCEGDSGGPLLCNGALVGVTSFGKGCGDIKFPGVYAFLSAKQLIWIKNTMKS